MGNKEASSPVDRDVLRMSPKRITRVALRWTPQGKRKQGKPKATW